MAKYNENFTGKLANLNFKFNKFLDGIFLLKPIAFAHPAAMGREFWAQMKADWSGNIEKLLYLDGDDNVRIKDEYAPSPENISEVDSYDRKYSENSDVLLKDFLKHWMLKTDVYKSFMKKLEKAYNLELKEYPQENEAEWKKTWFDKFCNSVDSCARDAIEKVQKARDEKRRVADEKEKAKMEKKMVKNKTLADIQKGFLGESKTAPATVNKFFEKQDQWDIRTDNTGHALPVELSGNATPEGKAAARKVAMALNKKGPEAIAQFGRPGGANITMSAGDLKNDKNVGTQMTTVVDDKGNDRTEEFFESLQHKSQYSSNEGSHPMAKGSKDMLGKKLCATNPKKSFPKDNTPKGAGSNKLPKANPSFDISNVDKFFSDNLGGKGNKKDYTTSEGGHKYAKGSPDMLGSNLCSKNPKKAYGQHQRVTESIENGEWDEDAMDRATELVSDATGTLEELQNLYEATGCHSYARAIDEVLDLLEKVAMGEI